MQHINHLIDYAVSWLWAEYTYVALLAIGLLFSLWSKFVQYRALTHGVALVRGRYDDRADPGALNHFQALSTALSGTVGLGNIGGVALAIAAGGPGALFWMWIAGVLGMAIKTVEVTLAMIYRDVSDPDNPRGGAMWVIDRGLGEEDGPARKFVARCLASLFCGALALATITGGNMFQSWNVANITEAYFNVPALASGVAMAVVTALVIIGGIRRIGDVTGRLVPAMCGIYLIGGIVVLVIEAANVPALLFSVVKHAFNPTEAQGAFLGATVWFSLTTGLKRAFFSNEAGQGTSPIAHAAAKTKEPVREGIVAGLEPFVDTCLVCTLTGLVLLATGTWNREAVGKFAGRVGVDTNVSMLPPPLADQPWDEGTQFFALVEHAGAKSSDARKLSRLEGTIVAARDDTTEIDWAPLPEGAQVVDSGIYLDLTGATLTGHAFDRSVPGLGKWLVTISCWMFAISTLISWSYYGEQATAFALGTWAVTPYRAAFCVLCAVATIPGFITTDAHLGNLADLGSGCMLFTNVPIVVLIAPRAISAIRDYFRRFRAGEMSGHRAPPLAAVARGEDVR
ncbi:MAG: sodium:alanine symporter family protein [Planctomycetes bacterium]|nr:sodium:alanine symporter family protein [Planctomycetota bacterium]